MAGPRLAAAAQVVDDLAAAGITATTDPTFAATNRPCVLIAPPALDYAGGTYAGPAVGWRLVCLSSHPAGSLAAWAQLDELVEQLAGVAAVERADPISYQLGTETVPAYLATATD